MVEPEPLAPTDREAKLAADLQTARAQAQVAARLVLELNGRLKVARRREQQLQQTIAALQSALQSANEALSHAPAAIQPHAQRLDKGPVPQAVGSELTQASATDPCPQLGLINDRDTRHGFASVKNRCYALKTPLEVTFSQQETFCLDNAHMRCPILTGEIRSPHVPIDTEAEAAQRAKRAGSRLTGRLNKR